MHVTSSVPRGTLLAAGLIAAFASRAIAQGPKIVPPRPCEAPSGTLASLRAPDRPAGDRRTSVAVIGFEESVSDAARLHVAWAVGAHIAEALGALPGLHVESPGTVARAWVEAGARVDQVARLLDADFVVTGRSAMRGGNAEISITLWHGAAEATRWERTFAYPAMSLGEIEDLAVAQIASFVGVKPGAEAATRRPAAAAYDAIARGDYFLRRPGPAAADSARAAYERATLGDTKSGVARARLARAYAVLLARTGRGGPLDAERALTHGLQLADLALKDEPQLAEAWTARAMLLRFRDPVRLSGAADAHRKAVALAPGDADAHHEYGQTLVLLGDERGAMERFRRALAIERNRASTLRAYGELEMLERRFPAACALLNASLAADETDPLTYALRAQVRVRLGEFRDAYSDAEIAARLGDERWGEALTVMILAGAQDLDRARREARALANVKIRGEATLGVREARYLSAALALTGDRDRAIAALRRARPQGAELRAALRDPMLDALRSDARFKRLAAGVFETGANGDGAPGTPSR